MSGLSFSRFYLDLRAAFDFVHSKKRNKLSAEKSATLVYIFSSLRLQRRVTAGDMVELCYACRKDWEDEAVGANETTNLVVQAMDVKLCDTSEDEDENMESVLESDEIAEDERDHE